jgi:hypothetical protein
MIDFDGLLSWAQVQSSYADSQVKVANSLADNAVKFSQTDADNAGKYAQADLTEQQAIQQSLKNVALYMGMEWDKEAHTNLIRQRNIALQRGRKAEEAYAQLVRKAHLVSALINGGSWDAVRDGWIAFFYIAKAAPTATLVQIYRGLKMDEDGYSKDSWLHPWVNEGAVVEQYTGVKDVNLLLQWAAKKTYYPKQGFGAWEYLSTLLEKLDQGAAEQTIKLEAKMKEAEAAAELLSKIDWDRLKTPAGKPNE